MKSPAVRNRIVLSLAVLFFFVPSLVAFSEPNEPSGRGIIRSYQSFYDSQSVLSTREISTRAFQNVDSVDYVIIPDSRAKGASWVRFPVASIVSLDTNLVLFAGQHRQVDLYILARNGEWRTYKPQDSIYSEHILSADLIPFRLDRSSDSMLYIRILPNVLSMRYSQLVVVPFSALNPDKLLPKDVKLSIHYKWFNWMTYGAIAMMLVYILFKYLVFRTPEFSAYIVYLTCILLTGVNEYIFTTPNGLVYRDLHHLFLITLSIFTYVFYMLFADRLLNLKHRIPDLHRFIRVAVVFMIIYGLIDLALNYGFGLYLTTASIFIVFQFILVGVSVLLIIRAYRLRDRIANYFITGSLFFVIGGLLFLISGYWITSGVYTWLDQDSILAYPRFYFRMGSILEILFFSMGLAYKSNQNEMQRALLETQLQEEQRQRLRDVEEARRIVIEEERNRVSRDLHDEVGMGLTRIRYLIEALRRKTPEVNGEEVEQIARESQLVIDTMHDIVWSLKEGDQSKEEFLANVRGIVVEYLESHDIRLDYRVVGEPDQFKLTPLYKRNLLLVIRESLHNVVRHSGADLVCMELDFTRGFLLRIQDNGKRIRQAGRMGNGIINMRKRVEDIDGNFEWIQKDGVQIVVQLNQNDQNHIQ